MDPIIPHENDVLLGRGPVINAHPGNQQLRSLVESQVQKWINGRNKLEKRAIARNIFVQIRNLQPSGRFLAEAGDSHVATSTSKGAQDFSNVPSTTNANGNPAFLAKKIWISIEQEKAVDKILKRLRQRGHDIMKQCRAVEAETNGKGENLDVDAAQIPKVSQGRLANVGKRCNGLKPTWNGGIDCKCQDVDCSNLSIPVNDLCWQPRLHWNRGNSHPALHLPLNYNIDPVPKLENVPQLCNHHQLKMNIDDAVGHGVIHSNGKSDISSTLCRYQSMRRLNCEQNNILQEDSFTDPSCDEKYISYASKTLEQNESGVSCGGVEPETDLCTHFEGSGLDVDSDNPSQETVNQLDASPCIVEYSLWQWITSSKPFNDFNSIQSSEDSANYTKSALLIALKLTECILEAEMEERNGYQNPIPLPSIASENVLVRTRKGERNEPSKTIDCVRLMSFVGDDLSSGTVMERLFAVGKVFYELFSMEHTPSHIENTNTMSIGHINLSGEVETEGNSHQDKKTHFSSSHASENNFNYISKLESNGIPWSLCTLVNNLLDCRHGSFCKDDAYASFADLQADLQLMVFRPSCFLDNIQISSKPKLAVQDKLYGREDEMLKLDELFKRHISGVALNTLNCTIISGEAGVGKSKLAMYTRHVTNQYNGYFLTAKFEQNQMSPKSLSTITSLFESLCEMLLNDLSPSELLKIDEELAGVVGSHPNILQVVPNLKKLTPSCVQYEESAFVNNCIDSTVSMRYLLGELLRIVSSYSKPITFVVDDIQFADHTSLLLLRYMLCSAVGTPIFFTLCHRDDKTSMSETFIMWLKSISFFSCEKIKLECMTLEAGNNLISDALHLSPRLTLPLSSVLHCKTRGNPLFLRQLLDSLTEQGYIFIDLKQKSWAWDLEKIIELEISDSVLELVMGDIQRLPCDLQIGLQVAACIGLYITEPMLIYLSMSLGFDLKYLLQRASRKGFIIKIAASTTFRFAHDKIQEAVYELIPDKQRRENHLRFGLAICTQTFNSSVNDDELFFAAVNQINLGGPTAVHEPSQMIVFVELNLKAGRRSIEMCDYNTAFNLFQHGRTFLVDNDWTLNYQLSLDLHDALADAALVLNLLSVVTFCSQEVASNARSFEDKLHCLSTAAKALAMAHRHQQSIEASFGILAEFGEDLPCAAGDDKLSTDINQMIHVLQSTSDDLIFGMHECRDKNMVTLVNVYIGLAHVLHYQQPWQVGSVSLRLVEITLKTGLSEKSPLAFAHFGGVLVTVGRMEEGCRLGKLALRLVDRKGSLHYKSSVICFVYDRILWASEPFQSIVEAHVLGHKAGQHSGDFVYGFYNQQLAFITSYVAGQSLDDVHGSIVAFISTLRNHGVEIFLRNSVLLLAHITALKEGLNQSEISHMNNIPSEDEILSDAKSGPSVRAFGKLHRLTRAFLFRQVIDDSSRIDISGLIDNSYHQLNPHFLLGYFFEGLTSFLLARQSIGKASTNWIERGLSILTRMRCWNEHSPWNWENKMLLLEAESMYTKGNFDIAESLYDSAIRSAHDHKFIHEEAIASELTGIFYHERGFHQKSYSYLVHSLKSYEMWGAHAVARRVGTFVAGIFGSECQIEIEAQSSLEHLFVTSQGKKRQEG